MPFKNTPETRFRRTSRLLTTQDFNAVFERRKTTRSSHFSLHQLPEGQSRPTEIGLEKQPGIALTRPGPRLGIVVPKKLMRGAVQRNQIKRLAREVFRHLAIQLPHSDLVIRLNSKIDPARVKVERRQIALEIRGLLEKIRPMPQVASGSS